MGHIRSFARCAVLVGAAITVQSTADAQSGSLRLVTWGAPGNLGQQGNRHVSMGRWAISADGRYTVFSTASNNLVADDIGRITDVFVHDRNTGMLERVSDRPDGAEADGGSFAAAISGDGRWIAFASDATDLTPVVPGWRAIYLHDRNTGETRAVATLTGDVGPNSASSPAISTARRCIHDRSTPACRRHRYVSRRLRLSARNQLAGAAEPKRERQILRGCRLSFGQCFR